VVDLTTEGVLIRIDGFGRGLGEDGAFAAAVAIVELATSKQTLLEGREVAGTDGAIVGENLAAVGSADAIDVAFAVKEHGIDQPGGLDAGEGAEAVEAGIVEVSAVLQGKGRAIEVNFGDYNMLR
jgi:hypothetical protein